MRVRYTRQHRKIICQVLLPLQRSNLQQPNVFTNNNSYKHQCNMPANTGDSKRNLLHYNGHHLWAGKCEQLQTDKYASVFVLRWCYWLLKTQIKQRAWTLNKQVMKLKLTHYDTAWCRDNNSNSKEKCCCNNFHIFCIDHSKRFLWKAMHLLWRKRELFFNSFCVLLEMW